jgi:hypothetical protein
MSINRHHWAHRILPVKTSSPRQAHLSLLMKVHGCRQLPLAQSMGPNHHRQPRRVLTRNRYRVNIVGSEEVGALLPLAMKAHHHRQLRLAKLMSASSHRPSYGVLAWKEKGMRLTNAKKKRVLPPALLHSNAAESISM